MEVIRAKNLGFCSGVKRALKEVEKALSLSKERNLPCYIYGDIVHNKFVADRIYSYGCISIEKPSDALQPGVLIIRTHGISDSLRDEFVSKGFLIVDATCPVVLHNQDLIRNADGKHLIIGYPGHSEVISLLGASKDALIIDNVEKLHLLDKECEYSAVIQTTFSSAILSEIQNEIGKLGLHISFLSNICQSSHLRRDGVLALKDVVDYLLVVGDKKSANSNELVSIAIENGMKSSLVESTKDINKELFSYDRIGLSAGASTPEFLYNEVEAYLRSAENGRTN